MPLQIQLEDWVTLRLQRVGRRIGVENNPTEVVIRALALIDWTTRNLEKNPDQPIVLTKDHEAFQPVIGENEE